MTQVRIIFYIKGIFCSLAQLQCCTYLMNTHSPGGTLNGSGAGCILDFRA